MMLTVALIFVVVAIAIAFFFLKFQPGRDASDEAWPYYSKKLLSPPEQVLYFRLAQALPSHLILAQVQLSRFLGVKKGSNFQSWSNRINRMSVDFLVCNKDSTVVAAIELDDATHGRPDRKVADAKKDKALASADIRVIRWHVKSIPDVELIQAGFLSK